MGTAISCSNVSKAFGSNNALVDVSLEFEENKIYGLLGRNGAGKTTFLKILASQLFADGGTVNIFGETPYENEEILRKVCLARESPFYPGEFNASDILKTGEALYPCWDSEFAARLVREFGLNANKWLKTLSKGMQSMVSIITGLASRAPVTIYDEAYLGLDASMRQLFYDILIEDYTAYPRTIIFSSHLIDECSSLLEEVVILQSGSVLMQEGIDAVKEKSFYIAGRKDMVEKYIKDKRVLHCEEMGRLVSTAVFSPITDDEQRSMERDEIEVQPMPLQKLFIYLTLRNGGGKA